MTIDQMHIEIDNGVQEMASRTQQRLEPEQYDMVINKMISRYVDMKLFPESDPLGKGFYVDQSRVNAIRSLIIMGKKLQLNYISDSVGATYYCELPNDYRHHIKIKSDVKYDCGDIVKLKRSSVNRVLSVLKVPKRGIYQNLTIIVNNKKLIQYERTIAFEELYMAINYFVSNTDNVYWENFGNVYEPNSFIIVSDNSIVVDTNLRLDESTIANGVMRYAHRTIIEAEDNLKIQVSPHELYSPEVYDESSNDPYAKTTANIPVSTIVNNSILTKVDDSFLLIATSLNYIRNPRIVDINLNISCDLPTNTHDEIVDMSVKYMVHAIENAQKFQLTTAEFLKR